MPAEFSFAGSRSGPQFVPGRRNPRRRPMTLTVQNQFDTGMLAAFKTTPSFKSTEFQLQRPLMGQCCHCMPVSRDDLREPLAADMGMRNILDVKAERVSNNVVIKTFGVLAYALRRPLFGPYPDLSMAVLTNRRVVEAIQKAAHDRDSEHEDKLAVFEKRARQIVAKMKASISSSFIKFTGWFLLKFLSIFLRGVLVQKGQMAILKKASERGLPMIYLPLHHSHLDYVLVTFILWNYDIRAPYVAAGDNMNIPFFSLLMRSLGGFFIRRKLDNGSNQKDIVYRAILHAYILEILKKGDSLEFFIEGGRTRTGRAGIPKGGLLSVVVDACMEEIIPDAYIVPLTLSYDKLLEGNFCNEQMGRRKVKESFWGACKGILNILWGDFGSVRVDFAQPYSIREFIRSVDRFPTPPLTYAFTRSDSEMSGLDLSQSAVSLNPYTAAPGGDIQDKTRLVVKALADHTVYLSVKTKVPMCSHCLAFLLLTKCRQGGTVASLAQAMDWLREELRIRNQDLGFCGTSVDVVLNAQNLLGPRAVQQSMSSEGEVFLKPNLTLPGVFELSYHASTLTASFLLESIMACAVILEANLMPSSWTPHQQFTELPTVSRDMVLSSAKQIADLLHAEFIILPPCRQLSEVLVETLGDFISQEILQKEESEYERTLDTEDRRWASRLAQSLAFDDDDEEDDYYDGVCNEQQTYKVNLSASSVRSKLQFFHVVLSPILESYLITAYYITQALDQDAPEDDFLKQLAAFASERAQHKLVVHMESCGVLTLKNAVKAFQELRIVDSYTGANLTMLALTEHFGVRERLHKYIEILKVSRS